MPDIPLTPSNLPRNVMDIPGKLLSPDEIHPTELPVEELAGMLRLNHDCYIGLLTPRRRYPKACMFATIEQSFPMPCHCLTAARDAG